MTTRKPKQKPSRIPPALADALSRLLAHHRAAWERNDVRASERVAAAIGCSRNALVAWRKGVAPISVFAERIVALAAQLPQTEEPTK